MCEGKDRLVSNHPPPLGSSCLNTALPVAVCSLEMFLEGHPEQDGHTAICPGVGSGAGGTWWLVSSGK
ncbi:dynein light chain LC8-type 2, isoform CRA_a [Rattus norvegicus]|uniref:Dynein light chain LC8-type 2, isoform CRA_a n=1 Tax=Rattus norvegicus TaxID=10116 RepID=A6HHW4_RAT|nr:dynein light chain LC8-type 2, isoform CRA_a [Rattus norvegicus]